MNRESIDEKRELYRKGVRSNKGGFPYYSFIFPQYEKFKKEGKVKLSGWFELSEFDK